MGVVIVRKGGAKMDANVKAFALRLQKEIKYWGRNSGTLWENGNTVSYRRVGNSLVAVVSEGLTW